jgi:hypothetical protein
MPIENVIIIYPIQQSLTAAVSVHLPFLRASSLIGTTTICNGGANISPKEM